MKSNSAIDNRKPAGAQRRIQQVLLEALAQARLRNPSYSLRAFSRRLKISPAALSEILNGKRDISLKLATKIMKNLGAEPQINHDVLASFQEKKGSRSQGKSAGKTKDLKESIQAANFKILPTDQFRTIADWYHFAILSLFETTSAPHDPQGIANRLGVRSSEIAVALERLERLGMILRAADGRYSLTGEQFHTSDGILSTAIKASHAQSFQLAQKSLEEDPIPLCDFTSLTMAINLEKLAKAKKMIREFRMNLARELEVDERDEVYMLCVQLFPVSRNRPIKDDGGRDHET